MVEKARKEGLRQRMQEVRVRYDKHVPQPDQLDGVPMLHTLRVRYLRGRPVELVPILLTVIISAFALGALVVLAGVPTWIALPIAPVIGWWQGQYFFHGDGLKVKEPYLHKEASKKVGDIVVCGPILPSSHRYEFIENGKAVAWEEASSGR